MNCLSELIIILSDEKDVISSCSIEYFNKKIKPLLKVNIMDTGIVKNNKILIAFRRYLDVSTLDDLLHYSEEDLLKARGLGKVTAKEIMGYINPIVSILFKNDEIYKIYRSTTNKDLLDFGKEVYSHISINYPLLVEYLNIVNNIIDIPYNIYVKNVDILNSVHSLVLDSSFNVQGNKKVWYMTTIRLSDGSIIVRVFLGKIGLHGSK